MKRSPSDENDGGTPPSGLTEAKCVKATGKFICPDHGYRQYNGETQAKAGVPTKRAKDRQRHIRPLVAGISWGISSASHYCTMGAILCDKKSDKKYFLTNQHCADENDVAEQPSRNAQDKVDNPSAKGPERVGKVIYSEVSYDLIEHGLVPDIAVVEIDDKVPVQAKVMTAGKHETKRVLGSKTLKEMAALADSKPNVCVSGRSGGWGCFPLHSAKVPYELTVEPPFDKDGKLKSNFGTDNLNPHYMYPGNSGSVFWLKDSKEDAYWAVGLFFGEHALVPMDTVFELVKKAKNLDLEVCSDVRKSTSGDGVKGALQPKK